jgi:hypothetical protein
LLVGSSGVRPPGLRQVGFPAALVHPASSNRKEDLGT